MTSSNDGTVLNDSIAPDLAAYIQAIDSSPYGYLGFMMAEERAKRDGTLDVFHKRLSDAIRTANPQVGSSNEPMRPYIFQGRAKDHDALPVAEHKKFRVFSYCDHFGVVYVDRLQLAASDYAALARLNYDTLVLDVFHYCTPRLLNVIRKDAALFSAKRGTSVQCNADGSTVVLGSKLPKN
jgi:hypothetical protein